MRLVFSGTHSTGKSTLVSKLSSQWPSSLGEIQVIQEVARSVLRRGLPLHHQSTIDTYLAITECHVAEELKFASGNVLIDRFLPDYAAYAVVHGNCPPDFIKLMQHFHSLLRDLYSYDFVFYLPIEFPLVPDGDRLPDSNYRTEVDAALKFILHAWEQPYHTLTGGIDKRLSKINAIL